MYMYTAKKKINKSETEREEESDFKEKEEFLICPLYRYLYFWKKECGAEGIEFRT